MPRIVLVLLNACVFGFSLTLDLFNAPGSNDAKSGVVAAGATIAARPDRAFGVVVPPRMNPRDEYGSKVDSFRAAKSRAAMSSTRLRPSADRMKSGVQTNARL